MKPHCPPGARPKILGFGLVEVLLGLLIGSVLVLGLGRLFGVATQAHQLIEGQLRLQESASYALHQIAQHLRSAGDFGCAASHAVPLKTLAGSWPTLFEFDLTRALGGIGGAAFSTALANERLAISAPADNHKTYLAKRGLNLKPYQPNGENQVSGLLVTDSDVLVTRRLGAPHFSLAVPAQEEDELRIRLNDYNGDGRTNTSDLDRFGFSSSRDPIVLVGDCHHRTLLRLGSMHREGIEVRLRRDVNGSGAFANTTTKLLPDGASFGTDAVVGPVETNVFFVATGKGRNNRQQPVLSLWRKRGINRPQEVVEGIERLVFYAGVDTDNDRIPNRYQPFSVLADFEDIVSIRFVVVANSVNSLTLGQGEAPRILRRAYSLTIARRNL